MAWASAGLFCGPALCWHRRSFRPFVACRCNSLLCTVGTMRRWRRCLACCPAAIPNTVHPWTALGAPTSDIAPPQGGKRWLWPLCLDTRPHPTGHQRLGIGQDIVPLSPMPSVGDTQIAPNSDRLLLHQLAKVGPWCRCCVQYCTFPTGFQPPCTSGTPGVASLPPSMPYIPYWLPTATSPVGPGPTRSLQLGWVGGCRGSGCRPVCRQLAGPMLPTHPCAHPQPLPRRRNEAGNVDPATQAKPQKQIR